MENNIDRIVEKEIKFCEENKFEHNEHGVFIYKSSNGFSSINLPYILKDYTDYYLLNNELYTAYDLRDEWKRGYDEGCDDSDGYISYEYKVVSLETLEYEFSVKTIKVKTPYDEMKFNLVKDMFDRFDLDQLEKLSSIVTKYDYLEKRYNDLKDNVDSLQEFIENIDDYDIVNLIHKIESLKY